MGGGLVPLILAIAIVGVPPFARLTRASVLSVKERPFVLAQRAAGASTGDILVRTILPNVLGPAVVQLVVTASTAILTESGPNFLGLGAAPPYPSFGSMLAAGNENLFWRRSTRSSSGSRLACWWRPSTRSGPGCSGSSAAAWRAGESWPDVHLLLQRFGQLAFVLALASIAVWLMIYAVPGSPELAIAGPDATEEQLGAVRSRLGLDRPLPLQYVSWLTSALSGDLGSSLTSDRPVVELLRQRIPATLQLVAAAMLIGLAIAIPAGVFAAWRPNGVVARLTNIYQTVLPRFRASGSASSSFGCSRSAGGYFRRPRNSCRSERIRSPR